MSLKQTKRIRVIGSGISGLSSAIELQERGHEVEIWTKDIAAKTVSAVAAAMWEPYLTKDPRGQAWSKVALERFRKEALLSAGVFYRTASAYFRQPLKQDPEWASIVDGYKRLDPRDLDRDFVDGYSWECLVAEMPIYLNYLLEQFHSKLGRIVIKEITDFDECFDDVDALVNCTGLASRKLCNDNEVHPIKGHLVLVERPPGFNEIVIDDYYPGGIRYIITRGDNVVLGGSSEHNIYSSTINPDLADAIHRRCIDLAPALKGSRIIRRATGLRPARSSVRLAAEITKNKPLIHNYGHGGSGMTFSWGCAKEVADLIEESYSRPL